MDVWRIKDWYSIVKGTRDNLYLVKSDYSLDSYKDLIKLLKDVCVVAERDSEGFITVRTTSNTDSNGVTDSVSLKDIKQFEINTSVRQINIAVENWIPVYSFESRKIEDAIGIFMEYTL